MNEAKYIYLFLHYFFECMIQSVADALSIRGCGAVLVICMVISPCLQLIGSRVEWRLHMRQ